MPLLSRHSSRSGASEAAESVASQLQPVKSAELHAHGFMPDLDGLQGGSMMALPKEPSKASVASGYASRMLHCT